MSGWECAESELSELQALLRLEVGRKLGAKVGPKVCAKVGTKVWYESWYDENMY